MRPRSRAFIFFHGPFSKAFRAALAALSTSALSPSATLAMTSPVAGLRVSKVLPLCASTHLPSISIFVWRILTGRLAACLPLPACVPFSTLRELVLVPLPVFAALAMEGPPCVEESDDGEMNGTWRHARPVILAVRREVGQGNLEV